MNIQKILKDRFNYPFPDLISSLKPCRITTACFQLLQISSILRL